MVGTYFLQELAKLRDQFPCVGDVRGKGLMIGVEMVQDPVTKTPMNNKHFTDLWEDCKNMGVLLGRGALNGNVSIRHHTCNVNLFIVCRVQFSPSLCFYAGFAN